MCFVIICCKETFSLVEIYLYGLAERPYLLTKLNPIIEEACYPDPRKMLQLLQGKQICKQIL